MNGDPTSAAAEIDCAILDLSDSGARILLPAGTDLPDSFDLSVDPDGQVKCCRVVWKAGTSVGVTFQTRVLL